MKKILLFLSVILLTSGGLFAQEVAEKKANVFSVGAGFSGIVKTSLVVGYEHMLTKSLFNDKTSLGLGVDFLYGKQTSDFHSCTKYVPTLKLNMYYQLGSHVDAYVGAQAGCAFMKDSPRNGGFMDGTHQNISWGAYVGVRYFFMGNFGVYAQAGYNPLSYASAGLAFRF